MDGDICPLREILNLCEAYNAHLILDEAHATGVLGASGEGLAQSLQLHTKIFAAYTLLVKPAVAMALPCLVQKK